MVVVLIVILTVVVFAVLFVIVIIVIVVMVILITVNVIGCFHHSIATIIVNPVVYHWLQYVHGQDVTMEATQKETTNTKH